MTHLLLNQGVPLLHLLHLNLGFTAELLYLRARLEWTEVILFDQSSDTICLTSRFIHFV